MRTIIIAALLLAANMASAQYTHKDRIGLVAPMNSYDLLKTGIRFKAGPIWWNPVHEIESPQSEWKVEYNFVLKWLDASGQTQSTTIKTWEPFCFWKGIKGTQLINCNVIAVPHHIPGKHKANDSLGCSFGISLINYPFEK